MKFETIHDHELGAPVRDVAQEAVDAIRSGHEVRLGEHDGSIG